jgi:hypothetical protein
MCVGRNLRKNLKKIETSSFCLFCIIEVDWQGIAIGKTLKIDTRIKERKRKTKEVICIMVKFKNLNLNFKGLKELKN